MTLVSIITPSYNQAQYLEQTIQSVLNQDYPRVEYIVIDGASSDGSVEIIQKHQDRLAYWISEKDSGQAEAINKGSAKATGEIIAWLNSDDYYLPGAIASAVEAFARAPEAAFVYGNMLAVDERGRTFNQLTYRQVTLEDLLCFQIIGQPAVFMRRSALLQAGGLDPTYHFMLDHHLWIRLARQGKTPHANQFWAAARYHPAAKNRAQAIRFGGEAFRILEEAKQDEILSARLKPVARRAAASAHRVNARYLLDGGQPTAALSAWGKALLIHPPTALARMNILVSSLLNLSGMEKLREATLRLRAQKYKNS